MKRSFIKLCVFFAIMAIPLIILSKVTESLKARSARPHLQLYPRMDNDTGWYFIGSSRVQMSVDTDIVKNGLAKQAIYNLGISGATFLTNCFVATELMKSNKPKVLFIELSAMLTDMPIDVFEPGPSLQWDMFHTARSFFNERNTRDQLLLSAEFANRYLSGKLFYYDQVRRALLHTDTTVSPEFGFIAGEGSGYTSDRSIFRWSEFTEYHNHNAVGEYRKYFQQLYDAARGTNTRVIFFMPLTFGSEMERELVIPVYNSLPDADKIVVTPGLATAVLDKGLLMNDNHFNRQGARVYSTWLVDELRRMDSSGYFNSLIH